MKKRNNVFYILCLMMTGMLAFNSCSSSKEVVYFQDLRPGESEIKLPEVQPITVRPEDKISIIVNSRDQELTNLFNLPYVTKRLGQPALKNGISGFTNDQGVSGYTVDAEGHIDFPVLGKVHVEGMQRGEIA